MFYDVYEKLCRKIGKSPSAVANELGLSSGTMPRWKAGAVPRNAQLRLIADYFGVTVEDLLDGSSSVTPSGIFSVEYKKIPLLGEIACGMPIYANEEEGVFVQAGSDLKADFCLKARGDSMTGARIYDGDLVFCKSCPIVDNGEIAAVIIEDEVTLKRFHFDSENQTVSLYPENPAYKTLRYQGEELNHIRVLGKAVSFQGVIK